MAIAIGSSVLGVANVAAGNYDTSITPAATPGGVCVVIEQNAGTGDSITSVAYGISTGAVSLTRLRFDSESTEAGGIYIYWAGGPSVFPAGAQTVRIVRTGTLSMRAAVWTMTVAAGLLVAFDSSGSGLSASVANPSWTHASVHANVVAMLGIHSGLTTMTNTPATNWTLGPTPGFEDIGNQGRGWASRTLATAGSLGAGWTAATADDFVGSSVAFYEASPTATPAPLWSQRSPRPVEQSQLVGPAAEPNSSTLLGG